MSTERYLELLLYVIHTSDASISANIYKHSLLKIHEVDSEFINT